MKMSYDPQQLGCYFLFNNLSSDYQPEALDIITRQVAVYSEFTKAMDKIYRDCLDPETNEPIKEPDTELIEIWRKKLHDVYEQCDKDMRLLIETKVCKSNKKAKKRFMKIKSKEEFYGKHVWSEQTDPEVFLKQLEFILKEEDDGANIYYDQDSSDYGEDEY